MKKLFALALIFSPLALAQDRTPPTVLESTITVTGGDFTVDATGCYVVTRIAPVVDQKPAQIRQMGAGACTTLKALALRAAKLDQGVGNGATP